MCRTTWWAVEVLSQVGCVRIAGGQHWNQVHGRGPAPESFCPNSSFTNDTGEIHISKSRILRHLSAQFPDINLLENKDLVADEFLHFTQ